MNQIRRTRFGRWIPVDDTIVRTPVEKKQNKQVQRWPSISYKTPFQLLTLPHTS